MCIIISEYKMGEGIGGYWQTQDSNYASLTCTIHYVGPCPVGLTFSSVKINIQI